MVVLETSSEKLIFAEEILKLFQNRDDSVVATYKPSSRFPVPVMVEDLLGAFYRHLFGFHKYSEYQKGILGNGFYGNKVSDHRFEATRIGVYSTDLDSRTKWAMIDLDSGGAHKKQIVDIDQVLRRIVHEAQRRAIFFHVEVSGSGKGYHVWLFFNSKVCSRYARELAQSLLPPKVKYLETETGRIVIQDNSSIEVNPKSETYDSVGTMAWLPLYHALNSNHFIDIDLFLKGEKRQDSFHRVYLNKAKPTSRVRGQSKKSRNLYLKAKGDFLEIINGCSALKRIWNSDYICHEARVVLMSLALNTSNGADILQNRWDTNMTEYQLKKASEKQMKPFTCKSIQSYGLCKIGIDPLLGDHCFQKYVNKENEEIEPSPVRLRSGARKVLRKIYIPGGKEMNC